ncbi:uncharacterized protein [Rutidosis leptorrhynchoides]|uniref:uncharacterized protein n=1 Tax=Rutidosis leptorrhynchoides TaxID=125765 RepID=UPI003A9A33DD
MAQKGVQLDSINEKKPLTTHQQQQQGINIPAAHAKLNQQQEINNKSVASNANTNERFTPNLGCRDFLIGPRTDYLKIGVPLYEASIKCDWKAAKSILDKEPELVRYCITENGETALHVAASAKGPKHVDEFVKSLLDMMTKDDLALENENYNTAFYLAGVAGNINAVKMMLEKNRALLIIPGSNKSMMPLYAAALFGHHEVVKYMYENSKELMDDGWTFLNRGWLLEKCVENDMFDIALKIVKKHPKLGTSVVLGILARKPEAFPEAKSNNRFTRTINLVVPPAKQQNALPLLKFIWEDIAKRPKRSIDDIIRGPLDPKQDEKSKDSNPDQALELQKLISEHIAKMHVETQNLIKAPTDTTTSVRPNVPSSAIRTYSNRVLFVATEMGNTKFLIELIRQYPDLIWKVNDDHLSIFHIAVKHRHEGIYNLLYEIGSMKDLITPLKDPNNNNMLHLVGKIAKQKRLQDVSGVALQMQRELLWFKEVEAMIPPSYRERKNKDGLTPYELFTLEHKDLVTQGEQWMKDTANQCMVVAALIATMVFAAAFTIPGGYDQNTGIPMFRSKATLVVFVVADAISLFSSSASILMFLAILTSRYAERDFLESLPNKLMLGLATLFLSITTMTLAFGVSFFALYDKGFLWIPILIGVFAVMPVLLYLKLQFSLFVDVIRSTYGSRYLFKPAKHVLYYENPKV